MVFNKIHNYPNFFLTKEEEKQQMIDNEMPFLINDPANYYCLGIYMEESNKWKCASRNLLEINDNIIEFNLPYPGIYAVIYNPIIFNKN